MRTAIILACLVMPVPSYAQSGSSVPAAAVDPARLTAARDLIDVIMPPATRDQMLDGMVRPMIANVQRNMVENPQFAKVFDSDPRAQDLFKHFMQQQTDRSLAMMRSNMPGMWEAMARAYARRLDVAQMREIKAFFETPTGRTYMQQSLTMMNDPDVLTWQGAMIRESMTHLQADVADFAHQVASLEQARSK